MGIDRMVKVSVAAPAADQDALIKRLQELGVLEVADAAAAYEPLTKVLEAPGATDGTPGDQLQKLHFVLELIDNAVPRAKSLMEKLVPLAEVVDESEIEAARASVDLDALYEEAQHLSASREQCNQALTDIDVHIEAIALYTSLGLTPDKLQQLNRTRILVVRAPQRNAEALGAELEAYEQAAFKIIPEKDVAAVVVAFLPDQETAIRTMLTRAGVDEVRPPEPIPGVDDLAAERQKERDEAEKAVQEANERIRALATKRSALLALTAYWEAEKRKVEAHRRSLAGRWTYVIHGYIRKKDLDAFRATLEGEFPGVFLTYSAPEPDDDVPVHLSLPAFVRPVSLLVSMYGLPPYRAFDPSAFLMISFYVFFGICFSDVGYGLLLILTSALLVRNSKQHESIANFARLFLYAGISTVVMGAALGSWFGDLFTTEYLDGSNPLVRLRTTFMAFEPLSKPVVALVLALAIGMINQLYGIVLRMYGTARRGDWAAAVFDGGFWLITLPGLVLIAANLFIEEPYAVQVTGFILFGVGALGLVLTQGRHEKTLGGKIIVGIVSLYGILGSYGCTAFIGDTLSYSRLLALGLTTSIVAMSVNLISSMLQGIPYIGWILFVVLLIAGHILNFFISVLGAFVHSARLIFVEFFGRFYSGGGRHFQPLSLDSERFKLKKAAGPQH
jgi:V/A-type H+/Na+-transporting ATPase subunit I